MMNYNLSTILEDAATAYPHRDAIVFGPTRLNYATVNTLANRCANLLASRGIGIGDKVALSCPNLPFFTIAYFGILKAGATVVPLNVMLTSREIAYHLDDSDARAYFCFEGTPELPTGVNGAEGFETVPGCEHLFIITADSSAASPITGFETMARAMADQANEFDTAATDDDDTAVILYTSGTTGQPKGAELRHRNMRDNALIGRDTFDADPARPDTYLAALPLFHAFGQTVCQNGPFAFGGTMVMMARFDATAALDLIITEGVTAFAGVPTMYWGLLGALQQDQLLALKRTLRIVASGGSALPLAIHQEFQDRFGMTVLEGYGLSETSPVASFSPRGEAPRPGSIGVAVPGVELKLLAPGTWDDLNGDDTAAVGEIAVRGHNVMKGYYGRPDATADVIRDGWFRTGDLARRDDDDWFYIVGRAKELIIRGGFNVYPSEVEEVLVGHPAVSLAAVIGVPHESHGEEIVAYVVPVAEATTLTEDDLIAWSRGQLAAYKYPRIVRFVDTLPMTATGKILKRVLPRAG